MALPGHYSQFMDDDQKKSYQPQPVEKKREPPQKATKKKENKGMWQNFVDKATNNTEESNRESNKEFKNVANPPLLEKAPGDELAKYSKWVKWTGGVIMVE